MFLGIYFNTKDIFLDTVLPFQTVIDYMIQPSFTIKGVGYE